MPLYEYKALSSTGKQVKGTKEAPNKNVLRDTLAANDLFLTEAVEKGQAAANKKEKKTISFSIGQSISKEEIKNFTTQFATLQKAAIPLVESLNALSDQAENLAFKQVLSDIRRQVADGSSLAAALAEHPKVFDNLYINMIRAGESSGSLDLVLIRLSDFLDSQLKLRSKIVGAMVYPLIMIVVGILLMMLLFVFVIPRVTKLFEQQRKPLPFVTKLLLGTADFVSAYWPLIIVAAIGLGFAFKKWISTPKGRFTWDSFKLKLPLLGIVVRLIAISRFAKTLATLLSSGVPLLRALEIVKNILGNAVLADVVEKAAEEIKEGDSIAAPLRRSNQFPPLMTHMIAVGERAGKLEEMLDSVAESYENQINARVEALTAMLEPLMIVVMGGTIGFVVFAILLPIM